MKIYVVGIGPGAKEDLTPRAHAAMADSDIIIGYKTYVDLVAELFPEKQFPEKQFIASGMKREVDRCRLALEQARAGRKVSLISSGDSGIYGMAGIMLEIAEQSELKIPVEIVPGITAASAAAALAGAPLMHDFAVISLSDLLTPWETICKRIEYAALGDFVISIYNPKSTQRTEQIVKAREIMLRVKNPATPVSIVRNVGRDGEQVIITTLEDMLEQPIDMFTVIIVGNSQSYVAGGKMITPRGYRVG